MKRALTALLLCYVLANGPVSLLAGQQDQKKSANSMNKALVKTEAMPAPAGFESLDYLAYKEKYKEFVLMDISEGKAVLYANNNPYFFDISSGAHRGAKEMEFDDKTPRGLYYACGSYPSKLYQFFIRVSYPNLDDAKRGLKLGIIIQKQYDAIVSANKTKGIPLQNTSLGGNIGIHGPEIIHTDNETYILATQFNWTQGCISTNSWNIEYLYKNIKKGTPIIILD
jgi:murein L,D-transpeptidase YafK